MTGLAAYMAALAEYLRRETGRPDPPTAAAMEVIGIPPSEWYRALLS